MVPMSIQVGPHCYRVYVGKMDRRADQEPDEPHDQGRCDSEHLLISLNDDGVPHDRLVSNLMHEVLHAVCDDVLFQGETHRYGEETIVSRFAPALVLLIRQNPSLVAYVQSTEAGD